MTKQEYVAFQAKIPGAKPPCIHCDEKHIVKCGDEGIDCSAFRAYVIRGTYLSSLLGRGMMEFSADSMLRGEEVNGGLNEG